MGQRLVVNIIANNEILTNAYYHWSAYTESAADITKYIINNVIKSSEKARDLLYYTASIKDTKAVNKLTAYLMLEGTGAGLYHADNDLEIKEFNKLGAAYNYRVGENRSDGLIALTPQKIKEFNNWAEGTVNIDISNDTVHFDVFEIFSNDDICELIQEGVIEKDEVKELDFENITDFDFENVDAWFDKIKKMSDDRSYPYFKDKNEPIYYQVIA